MSDDVLAHLQTHLNAAYRVERKIGEGGMATVYLARDLKHDRNVAIKTLKSEVASSIGPDRFLREIEIASKLQHPHIIPVYDSGDADGVLFYVMPHVEGEALDVRIQREESIPPEQALEIAREVADALDYAHRQGVVHRDIKPANILLSQGHAMIADFGIARAASASSDGAAMTQAGMAIGTPSYMSPEQAMGATDIDGRTDIYALGTVLFEMLSGRPPFEGPTPQSIVAKVIADGVPKLSGEVRVAQGVVEKAMAKDPDARFADAREFADALRAPAAIKSSGSLGWKIAGVAGLATMVVVAATQLIPGGFSVDGDPRKSLVVFPFENQTGDAGLDYLENASMNLIGLAVAHWDDMRVYDDERTSSLLRRRGVEHAKDIDFDAAQAMAQEAKVGTLVLGDIRRERDSLAIEAKVHDVATGERVSTEIVRIGYDEDPRPVFDSIAARLLQISGAPAREHPGVLAQTTRSLDAYRAYIAGNAVFQRFQVDSAVALFDEAIALDSTFALAYIQRANVDGWLGIGANPTLRQQMISQARRYSQNLPSRLRTLVDYHSAYAVGDFPRARRYVEDLIGRDSTDVEAWYQLGEAHFHDPPTQLPPEPDAGNMGKALHAFDRTLLLDSSYTLAYQHIFDALNRCTENMVLCMADSAVYNDPQTLRAVYGADRIQQIHDEARARQIDVVRGWVAASPGATRARTELVRLLIRNGSYAEARGHIIEMETFDRTVALILRSLVDFYEGAYREAGLNLQTDIGEGSEAFFVLANNDLMDEGMWMLGGAGLYDALESGLQRMLQLFPGDSINGPQGVLLAKEDASFAVQFEAAGHIGYPPERASQISHAWLDVIIGRFAIDSAESENLLANSGATLLAAYLGSRDTTLLTRFLAHIDTSQSRTWRPMEAHLELARGDTATAQAKMEALFVNGDSLETPGRHGIVRLMAWAEIMATLGDVEGAIEQYARLDDEYAADVRSPALHVRSFAERAALYQRLGRSDEAIAMYEKFIDAWQQADPDIQPLVDRARTAIAEMREDPTRR